MTEVVLRVRNLSKVFEAPKRGLLKRHVGEDVHAVKNVSFTLERALTLGIVGESGSGKTTLARCILRAIDPSSGTVDFASERGWVDLTRLTEKQLKPLRRELQMIFQDPFSSLNPRMTVRRIIEEPLVIHGVGPAAERLRRVREMLDLVGLPASSLLRFPHAFSGGQRQRIGIARALVLRPRVVVCDESVSALDVSVQAQVINLLQDLQQELGLTYLFVAHDLAVVRHIADQVLVMRNGAVVEQGPTARIFDAPKHPYTKLLLSAIPSPDPDQKLDLLNARNL